jgi:hypothetical protein
VQQVVTPILPILFHGNDAIHAPLSGAIQAL